MDDNDYDNNLYDPSIKIEKYDRLLMMSFKLPIQVERLKDNTLKITHCKSMLYPTIFKLKDKSFIKFKWIGWPGIIPRNDKEK